MDKLSAFLTHAWPRLPAARVVYLLFCVSDYAIQRFGAGVLITSVPVSVGLLRYLQLIIVHGHGESPTDLVLSDRGMLAILAVFGMTFAYLIYF